MESPWIKDCCRNLRRNDNGSVLVVVLIVLATIPVMLYALMPILSQQQKNARRVSDRITVQAIQQDLKVLFEAPESWSLIRADSAPGSGCNPKLRCIQNVGIDCNSPAELVPFDVPQPISCLYNLEGQLIFDGRQPQDGITPEAQRCTTFSMDNPDPACPFRPQVTFKSACEFLGGGSCIGQTIDVYIGLLSSISPGVSLNMDPVVVKGIH